MNFSIRFSYICNVRKAINIVVIIFLLTATIGVTVSKHYCMGRLKAQWIGHEHKEVCGGMESMPGMEGCCSNESLTFVLDQDFSSVNFDFNVNPELVLLYTTYEADLISTLADPAKSVLKPRNTGPPFVEPDIFIQVQSFLL